MRRYLPDLRRWASGRLPRWARHARDTDDVVQASLIAVFRRIEQFEYRGEGALLAYLRQAVLNRIRNDLGLTYPELASALANPSPAAARMAVTRVLVRLAEEMDRVRDSGSAQPGRTGRR